MGGKLLVTSQASRRRIKTLADGPETDWVSRSSNGKNRRPLSFGGSIILGRRAVRRPAPSALAPFNRAQASNFHREGVTHAGSASFSRASGETSPRAAESITATRLFHSPGNALPLTWKRLSAHLETTSN